MRLGRILWVALFCLGCSTVGAQAPDTVIVESGGLKLRALLWRPSGSGPFPAVLLTTAVDRIRDCSGSRSSGRSSRPMATCFSASPRIRPLSESGNLRLLDSELEEVMAGVALLRGRGDVSSRRVAVAGHSFGGSLTLLAAGARFDATSDRSVRWRRGKLGRVAETAAALA